MSWVKDNVFGGAAKDAAKQQTRALEQAQDYTREATQQARGDIMDLFPQAQAASNAGYQQALNMFGQAAPQQMQMAQQGNQNAQATLLAGLPQMNNALLGMPVDYSALQQQNVTYDPSLFSQQLPPAITGEQPAAQQQFNEFDKVMGNQNYAGVPNAINFLGGTNYGAIDKFNPSLMRLK